MVRNLPVGSGEAESGIRHVIKRCMDVAGAWTEKHADLMLGLLAIRASGWWDDFWAWQHSRDQAAWRQRLDNKTNNKTNNKTKVVFRNKRSHASTMAKAA